MSPVPPSTTAPPTLPTPVPTPGEVLAHRVHWLSLMEMLIIVNVPVGLLGGPPVSAAYAIVTLILALIWLMWLHSGLRRVRAANRPLLPSAMVDVAPGPLLPPGWARADPASAWSLASAAFGLFVILTTPLWASLGEDVVLVAAPVGAFVVVIADGIIAGATFRITAWRDWFGVLTSMPLAIPAVVQTAVIAAILRGARSPAARRRRRVVAGVLLVSEAAAVVTLCLVAVDSTGDDAPSDPPAAGPSSPGPGPSGIDAAIDASTASPTPFELDVSFDPIVLRKTDDPVQLRTGTCLTLDTYAPDWDVAPWSGDQELGGDVCLGADGVLLAAGAAVPDEATHETCTTRLEKDAAEPAGPFPATPGTQMCARTSGGTPAAVVVADPDPATGTPRLALTIWAH